MRVDGSDWLIDRYCSTAIVAHMSQRDPAHASVIASREPRQYIAVVEELLHTASGPFGLGALAFGETGVAWEHCQRGHSINVELLSDAAIAISGAKLQDLGKPSRDAMSTVLATVLPLVCIALFHKPIITMDARGGSELRGVISMIADSIATGDFENENLSMMGREPIHSNQFRRFVYLADSATTEELYALAHHKSPVVRCYAFDALAYRHPSGFLRTINQEQDDTAKFRSRFFDVVDFSSVKEHLNGSTVSIYLHRYTPDSTEYSFIREMTATKRVPNAVIALAQFRRPEDTELIGSYLNERRWILYGLEAISRFPADLFFVRLKQIHRDQLSQPLPSLQILVSLYEALLQYQSEASLTTMKDGLSAADDFAASMNRVALAVALARCPSTYFESAQKMLILSEVEKNAVQEMLASPD